MNYGAISGTLTFQPGVTAQAFKVGLIRGSVNGAPLTVNLTLKQSRRGALLGTPSTAVLRSLV